MKYFLEGNVRLLITFWIFLIGGHLFFETLIYNFKNDGIEKNLVLIFLALFCSFIYDFVIIIATWNSSTKYKGKKIWEILAKIVVVIKAILLVISILWLINILLTNPDFIDLILSKLF